jgi:hypothetical protein
MMTLRSIPSQGWEGRIVPAGFHGWWDCDPPWREWLAVYDKLTPRLILILRTYSWGLLVRQAWPPDQPAGRGGGHVQGGAQSESSVRALVRTRPLIIHTLGDIDLSHPDRVVSWSCRPRRPR